MGREEQLFRRLERKVIAERLQHGFGSDGAELDIDGFIGFSLSVQNRRKSRAGFALEHHLAAIFTKLDVSSRAEAVSAAYRLGVVATKQS